MISPKKNSSLKLLRTSAKLLELTRGKLDPKETKQKTHKSARLPPLPHLKPRLNIKCRQVNLGTISIIKNEGNNCTKSRLLHKNLSNSTRNKLKLKTIHWLISNYREEVDRLLDNCRLLIQNTNYRGHISHQNFEDIMSALGLGFDKILIDRLFWVFDEDGDGKIEPREIMVGLEMFRETNFKEKLEIFFDICDEDGSGDIDEEEFYNVLKLSISSNKERKILKDSLHDLFVAIDEDGNGVLTKDEIVKAAAQSESVKTIIEKSIMTCQGVDTWIANDFYNGVNLQNFGGAGYRKNGVSHVEIDNLVAALEVEESLYEQRCKVYEENKKKVMYWIKENEHTDLSFDDKPFNEFL